MNLDNSVDKRVEEIIIDLGFELYEIKYFTAGGKTILRIFVDSDNGITLDDCAGISRALSDYFDGIDFGKSEYTLEVSSPGADRTLTTLRDFVKVIGKKVKLRLREEKKSKSKKNGVVQSVDKDNETITINTGTEDEIVSIENILSGKIEF